MVKDTDKSLLKICDFLNVEAFSPAAFNQGIRTQHGDVWSSNSSFGGVTGAISSSSIGKHKKLLSQSVNEYISTICLPELSKLSNIHTTNITSNVNFLYVGNPKHHLRPLEQHFPKFGHVL